MIDNAPTVKEIPTKIPINVFEQLISQEPILDKIRAEIAEPKNPSSDVDYDEGWEDAIKDCLRIIDKYKVEQEET
ncbi:MAG: hypothetical protein J5965_12220 [Aeriscardovia sp.]|nr:hypothetical protein [Aeriscardovia sp.]